MKTTVNFELSQEDKKGLRTIQAVSYEYDGKAELNIGKVAQSVTNSVFRKLAIQNSSSVNFGIKVSRPFNLVVTINNEKVLDIAQCMNQVTDNSKLKIKNKLYKENAGAAMEAFKNDIIMVIGESEMSDNDYKDCIEIAKPKKSKTETK